MRRSFTYTALSVVVVCLGACGGEVDSTGESVPFDTGVPESKPLSSLDAAEGERVCTATRDAALDTLLEPGVMRGFCIGLSAAFTESRAECIEASASCNDIELTPAIDEAEAQSTECDTDSLATCDATIGEYEACLSQTLGALARLADVTCDSEETTEAEDPPACRSLRERCPDLFESEDEGSAVDLDYSPPECDAEIDLGGAVDANLDVTGCSSGFTGGINEVSIGFSDSDGLEVELAIQAPIPADGEPAYVPATVTVNPYAPPTWRTRDGACNAHVNGVPCEDFFGDPGRRYEGVVECSEPALPVDSASGEVWIDTFVFESMCAGDPSFGPVAGDAVPAPVIDPAAKRRVRSASPPSSAPLKRDAVMGLLPSVGIHLFER